MHRSLAFALALFPLAVGCADDEKAPLPTVPSVAAAVTVAAPQEAGETPDLETLFAYDASHERRDPYADVRQQLGGAPLPDAVTPLQRLSLDQLRLVGVVSGVATPKAMVEGPDGRGHTLKVGTLVGRNFGVVKRISSDRVVIEERYRTSFLQQVRQEKILKLHRG